MQLKLLENVTMYMGWKALCKCMEASFGNWTQYIAFCQNQSFHKPFSFRMLRIFGCSSWHYISLFINAESLLYWSGKVYQTKYMFSLSLDNLQKHCIMFRLMLKYIIYMAFLIQNLNYLKLLPCIHWRAPWWGTLEDSFFGIGIYYSYLPRELCVFIWKVDKRKTRIIRKLHSAGERERLGHCRTGLKITKMHFISCIHGNLSNKVHNKKSRN